MFLWQVTCYCGTPTEKASEFLDHRLKPVMQNGWSYIKDSRDFLEKIGNMVTAGVVGLYPNIPHKSGLKTLGNMLEASVKISLK